MLPLAYALPIEKLANASETIVDGSRPPATQEALCPLWPVEQPAPPLPAEPP